MVKDKELINKINNILFKSDRYLDLPNKSELILYKNREINLLYSDVKYYILNILNQVLAKNINSYNLDIKDLEDLNDRFKFLGFKMIVKLEKPRDLNLYGYVIFKENKKHTEYFNILNSDENCLFIDKMQNQPIDYYSSVYTTIKSKPNYYILFVVF